MLKEVEDLAQQALTDIASAPDSAAVEELRIRYLGRRSRLRKILGDIGSQPPAERPAIGQVAGGAQKTIEAALGERLASLEADTEAGEWVDVTLPGRRPRSGALHPLTFVRYQYFDLNARRDVTFDNITRIAVGQLNG